MRACAFKRARLQARRWPYGYLCEGEQNSPCKGKRLACRKLQRNSSASAVTLLRTSVARLRSASAADKASGR